MDPVRRLLKKIDNLPTLPDVHLRISRALDAPDADLGRVGEMIALDPVLSARLIRMANSALFGSTSRAETIQDALMRIGTRETRNLVMTAAVIEVFDGKSSKIDLQQFWTLSLASALCARRIARDVQFASPEQAYLGALVHCLGEIVLSIYYPDRFEKAVKDAEKNRSTLIESEWIEFGFTHTALCRVMLDYWNFPEPVAEAVEYHLDPAEAPTQAVLASVIFAADRICRELGFGAWETGTDQNWLAEIPSELSDPLVDTGTSDLASYVAEQKDHLAEVATLVSSVFR